MARKIKTFIIVSFNNYQNEDVHILKLTPAANDRLNRFIDEGRTVEQFVVSEIPAFRNHSDMMAFVYVHYRQPKIHRQTI